MTKRILLAAMLATVVGFGTGCDDKSIATNEAAPKADSQAASAANGSMLPPSLRLATSPADAKDVAGTKAGVKDGDRVVVKGVVAGRADPIAENRAILTLLDSGINTCDKNPADGCKTPWDACCEPADVLAKNSVTVQVVDASGRPLKSSLASIEGVKPLAKVVVTGLAKVSADGVVLVNADGLYVTQ